MGFIFRASLKPLKAYFTDQTWVILHIEAFNHILASMLWRQSHIEFLTRKEWKYVKQKKIVECDITQNVTDKISHVHAPGIQYFLSALFGPIDWDLRVRLSIWTVS